MLCDLSKGLLCVLGRIVLLSGGGCPPNYLGCVVLLSVSRAVCASFVNSFTYIFVWSMLITNSNSNLSQWQSQKRNPQTKKKRKVNYKTEYRKYHSSDRMKKERALRNKNRRRLIVKEGSRRVTASISTIRTVIPRNNGKGNLRVIDAKRNRKKQ